MCMANPSTVGKQNFLILEFRSVSSSISLLFDLQNYMLVSKVSQSLQFPGAILSNASVCIHEDKGLTLFSACL